MSGRGSRTAAALLGTLAVPWLPLAAAALALHPRTRPDLRQRLGLSVPPVPMGVVWVHAASVGEIAAAEALVATLPGPVLLTADTDTGAERAREIAAASGGKVTAGVRPLDHPWTVAPLWAAARPRAVVLVEGTWSPQLAARCSAAGVPLARVSAKAGARTRRWARRWWYAPVTDATSLVVARDEGEAAWFRAAGCAHVVVGGDLKAARPLQASPLRWSRPFVVGCSTRGEERPLADAVSRLRSVRPSLGLVVAPRHRERFDAVDAELRAAGHVTVRRSALADGAVPDDAEVVLLDTVGELAGVLAGASAALIGGTFDPAIGGHSPIEAARHGVPIVAGPHRAANAAAFDATGFTLCARLAPEAIAGALRSAIDGPPPAAPAGDAAQQTAAAVIAAAGEPAPERAPRPWAAPGALAYGGVMALRHAAYDLGVLRAHRLGVPVVSVGSTNARGPGKTPTARWVADELARRGHRVGVAVRGYRRARPGQDVRISTATRAAADLGDEGALHARAGHLVAAAPDRLAACRALVAAGATAIVLDDGLQHRRVHRDVDLLVVDARAVSGRGLIPAGERRELSPVPSRVHGVVVHHGSLRFDPGVPVVTAHRVPGPWHLGESRREGGPEGEVVAFAGLAQPQDFFGSLVDLVVVETRALPDHSPVNAALARELRAWAGARALVCSAKDAVRLPEELFARTWWRDVALRIEGVPEAWFPPG